MVDEAAKTGAIHEHASELASRALDFDRLVLRDVMLPRARIDALPMQATMDQIRRFLLEERRSRIPVYDRSLDDILGYVSAKDIVSLAWDGGPVVLARSAAQREVLPARRVSAIEVLRFMQRERQRIAIAVDEHGVVSGMVTFEDLVEELVGDIFSERDEGVRAADARTRRRGRRAGRHADPRRQPGARHRAGGAAGRHHHGRPLHRARRAEFPTATRAWRPGDGSVLVVLEVSARTVKRVRVIPRVTNDPAPA